MDTIVNSYKLKIDLQSILLLEEEILAFCHKMDIDFLTMEMLIVRKIMAHLDIHLIAD